MADEGTDTTPLASFFAKYPTFDYNRTAQCNSEFNRMCRFFSWGKSDKKAAKKLFQDALTIQFNQTYGYNLPSWHLLCEMLGVDPLPSTIGECEKIFNSNIHVNIVDLVENPGERVQVFKTVEELSEYSKAEGKIFPRETAKAGRVLKFLLREIGKPELAARRKRSRKKRRRGRGGRGRQ